MDEDTARTLLQLAEEPGLWLPPEPTQEIVSGPGYSIVFRGRSAAVHRIRLDADAVVGAVEVVRARCVERGLADVVWWVGELSSPRDLAERLERLGFEPAEPARLTSFGITRRPTGSASAEVRRVAGFEDFLRALEIDWEAFGVDEQERAERRRNAARSWAAVVADGSSSTYIATLDGEAAGFARAVFTPHGAILIGGATLPAARGHGVYTSTVLARWDEAVERGVPRIAVSAGSMSAPVLERLGFARLGTVQLLRDRL